MAESSAIRRLYRGETRLDFIGHRRRFYYFSLVFILISIVSFAVRGFNVGVEFKGGTQYQITVANTYLLLAQRHAAITPCKALLAPPRTADRSQAAATVGLAVTAAPCRDVQALLVALPAADPHRRRASIRAARAVLPR